MILIIMDASAKNDYLNICDKKYRTMLGGVWGWEYWQECWHWHWHSSYWESKGTERKALQEVHLQDWPRFLSPRLASGACKTLSFIVTIFAIVKRRKMNLIMFMFNINITLCSIQISIGG